MPRGSSTKQRGTHAERMHRSPCTNRCIFGPHRNDTRNAMTNVYDLDAKTIDGAPQSLSDYRGKTLLIVNVASKCGFTPQYAGLEAMYRRLKDRGLVILGFPCDQFGHQEPGDEKQ